MSRSADDARRNLFGVGGVAALLGMFMLKK